MAPKMAPILRPKHHLKMGFLPSFFLPPAALGQVLHFCSKNWPENGLVLPFFLPYKTALVILRVLCYKWHNSFVRNFGVFSLVFVQKKNGNSSLKSLAFVLHFFAPFLSHGFFSLPFSLNVFLRPVLSCSFVVCGFSGTFERRPWLFSHFWMFVFIFFPKKIKILCRIECSKWK